MDLKQLREEIDKIDDQLVQLFVQRMEVSSRIADYKKENGLPILVPSREQEKLQDVAQKAGPDMEVYTRVLYDLLFELSRGYQSQRNASRTTLYNQIASAMEHTPKLLPKDAAVACLTCGESDTEMVCRKLLGNCSILPFKSTESILSAVSQGLCRYGMLPVNNDLKEILDKMARQQLYIIRACRLSDASQYIFVARKLEIYPGANRSTIRMALSDRPGALHKVLSRLYTLGINVVRLESRPIRENNFQAMFYFDLETSVYSEEFLLFICELQDLCRDFTYLGSYTEVV